MIDEELIRQEAEKLGITVTDEEVEKFIQEETYNFFPNGTATPTITPTTIVYPSPGAVQMTMFPSTATPTTAPTSTPDLSPTATAAPPTPTFVPEDATPTATPYTQDGYETEYKNTLAEYKAYGVSESTFRSVFRNILLRDKVLEAVTVDEVTAGEQVWARHILVTDESLAGIVRSLLEQGEDFAEVAKKYSTDTGSARSGGDLGWFGKGAMVPQFEEAAFSQEIGEIGQPVQSQFGYHIIQVLDRQEISFTTFQLQQNRETSFTDWLAGIRESADIVPSETWTDEMPPMPAGLALQ